jgi:hypothetical protein
MKQSKNKYLRLLLIAAMVFSLQSCLKNNKYYTDFSKGNPAVELPLAATHANNPFAVSFDITAEPTTYYAVVNVASVNKPTSTVTATLAIDQAYLDSFNRAQTALDPDNYVPYELLPDSTYSISSLNATIAPGHREDSIPIQIFTSKLDASHLYVLPLTIVKASLPISNWNHLLLNIGAKNQYDGVYKVVSGEFFHPSFGDQVFDASAGITQELVTTGINSLSMYPTKTPLAWFGAELDITVNPDNSLTEVFNGVPTVTPNNDHYDPNTRTFYVSGAYSTRKYHATLVYQKPR